MGTARPGYPPHQARDAALLANGEITHIVLLQTRSSETEPALPSASKGSHRPRKLVTSCLEIKRVVPASAGPACQQVREGLRGAEETEMSHI